MCISVDGCANAMGINYESALNTVNMGLKRSRKGLDGYQYILDPEDARKKWIVVESLPYMTGQRVLHYYGDIDLYHNAEQWISIINTMILPADGVWYLTQKCTETKAKEYARACAWLRFTDSNHDTQKYTTMQERYEMIIAVLKQDKGHCLRVTNWRSLRNKVVAFNKDGRASLLSGKIGNDNSKKVTEIGVNFIVNSYASPLKPTVREVAILYNQYAQTKGWSSLTEERVRQILCDPETKQATTFARDGQAVGRNMYERTIKRQKPSFADALWTLDGFTIQLRYQENGKPMSDLYCIGIMDVYSDNIVGYALGTVENSVLVQQAIRAAIRNTMKMPLQLQYDNSSANKSAEATELFNRIAKWAFPTAPYNGKSKPIENLIGRLEGHNMRHMPNFKGGNITSHSLAIKANPEFLQGQKLPDMKTVIEQVGIIIDVHNNTLGKDGKTPIERYNTPHPMRRNMDYLEMVQAFWVERKDTVRYTKDGLIMEVNKERYTYEVEIDRGVEDMEFRSKWLGTKFNVKYDPDDLEYISLWYEGEHISEARQKWLAPMAIVDMEEGDRERINKALAARKEYPARLAKKIKDHKVAIEDEGGLPTELNYYDFHKDAYNRRQERMLDEEISVAAMAVIGYQDDKKKKPNNFLLYGDEPGSMAVLED
jgi:nicotinamide mononucleotide adenylyltransferase